MIATVRSAVMVVGCFVAFTPMSRIAVEAQTTDSSASVLQELAGSWKAPTYKVGLSSDLDVAVWGPGASKVRNVELVLEPSGAGVLRVSTSVLNRQGRVAPFSASVVEARLSVRAPETTTAGSIEPPVTVLSAEERYLDDDNDRRSVDGLTVKLHSLLPIGDRLNVRFDLERGTGSFGETLVRDKRPAGARMTSRER
jgi:hypothetical protein